MQTKRLKRGSIKKADCTFVGGWVPRSMAQMVDRAVAQQDTDRSKFIRAALKEKLQRDLAAA